MITIIQANNTHEVVEHIKPSVALAWVNGDGRALDTFNRTFFERFPEFGHASNSLPADRSNQGYNQRRTYQGYGYIKTDRVYITAVAGRLMSPMTVINQRNMEPLLRSIAQAMRQEGLDTLVLPVISTRRTAGLRTIPYLEMLDRVFHDMKVYVATAVPLRNHGFAYSDITTCFSPKPKIEVKRRPAVPTHGWTSSNPYSGISNHHNDRGFVGELDPELFKAPIKVSFA